MRMRHMQVCKRSGSSPNQSSCLNYREDLVCTFCLENILSLGIERRSPTRIQGMRTMCRTQL